MGKPVGNGLKAVKRVICVGYGFIIRVGDPCYIARGIVGIGNVQSESVSIACQAPGVIIRVACYAYWIRNVYQAVIRIIGKFNR